MRIDGWSITAFGPLALWQMEDLSRHNVLVVLGPNESGKSALFEFFASALFGFAPARADRHPYKPWDGRFLEGSLDVMLRDGVQARLSRRLTSRPEGQVSANGRTERLGNQPVPWVGLMNRGVFTNVYALTQEEALQLDHHAWRQVQDRVLGGSSFDFLRPSREVVSALDTERARLWRPDRRGKPQEREITASIRQLRDGLHEASGRRARIEASDGRLAEIEAELSDNIHELQRIELALERDATLAPLVRRAQRMDESNAQADTLVPAGALPDDTPQRRTELTERLAELQEQRGDLQRSIEQRLAAQNIDDPTRFLLEARDTIERLDSELSRAREDQARVESMTAESLLRAGTLRELAGRTLASEQIDESARAALLELPVRELEGRFDAWQESHLRLADAHNRRRELQGRQQEIRQTIAEREPSLEIEASMQLLLGARADIERLDREHSRAQENEDRLAGMDADLERTAGALDELTRRVLASEHVDDTVRNDVLGLSMDEVHERFAAWRAARQQVDTADAGAAAAAAERARLEQWLADHPSAQDRAELDERLRNLRRIERAGAPRQQPAAQAFSAWILLGAALAAAGAFAFAFGAPPGTLAAAAIVGVLVIVGAIAAAYRRSQQARRASDDWNQRLRKLGLDPASDVSEEIERVQASRDAALRREAELERLALASEVESKAREHLQASEAEASNARDEFLAVTARVPIAPTRLEAPTEGLVRNLEAMRQAVESKHDLCRDRDDVTARLSGWRDEVERLCQTLSIDLPTEPFEAAPAARRALSEALNVERAAKAAAADIHRLRQQLAAGKDDMDAAETEHQQSETAARTAQADFLAVIADIPVTPIQREKPGGGLVRDLSDMRQTLTYDRRLRRNRADVAKRLDAWRAEVEGLRGALQLDLPADPFEAAPAARRALPDALEIERAAKAAEADLPQLRQDLETCGQDADAAALELERLDAALARLDPGQTDPLAGLATLTQAQELRGEARRIRAELDRERPDWSTRTAEARRLAAAGKSVGLSDDDRVAHRLRADELRARGQELADERGRLAAEREQLTREPGPAHVSGAIQAAEERLDLVRRQHDRLALLRQVILTAERSYRERYQAPLLTAAGRHLRRFTNGRYDLLTMDDVASTEVELQVRRTGEDFPTTVDTPLSRGTIQQIYFALRLAMVDLIEGDEPLPLFLDEMFVNWDPERTSSGLEALAAMPGDRQVFLFTADPYWAERAAAAVPTAHVVRTPQ